MRKRWIQHPETGELVEAEKYVRPRQPGHYIMEDIKPYQSTITGEVISSRSKHRQHLKQHNCIEVGNEKMSPNRIPDVPGRKEAIVETCKKLGYL